MTRLIEGLFKLGFMTVGFYLVMKHWVGATNLMKEGSRSTARIFTSLAEPGIVAKRLF